MFLFLFFVKNITFFKNSIILPSFWWQAFELLVTVTDTFVSQSPSFYPKKKSADLAVENGWVDG